MRSKPVFASLLLIAFGCAPKRALYVDAEFRAWVPVRVAVLPFLNQSTDLTGPVMLRKMLQQKLSQSGWNLVSLEEVDEKLKELGVTDAGQLKVYSQAELGSRLGAESLLYGELEEFSSQNVGVYSKREVRLGLKLFQAKDGLRLWEDMESQKKSDLKLNKQAAARSFVKGLAARAAENIFQSPLRRESEEVVRRLVNKLNKR